MVKARKRLWLGMTCALALVSALCIVLYGGIRAHAVSRGGGVLIRPICNA